jgi:hypothetical protein
MTKGEDRQQSGKYPNSFKFSSLKSKIHKYKKKNDINLSNFISWSSKIKGRY